jgi:hypothetical protein
VAVAVVIIHYCAVLICSGIPTENARKTDFFCKKENRLVRT